MTLFLILAYLVIVLFEVPSLIQKKYWREFIAFSVFLSGAFFLSLLLVFDIAIPSPIRGVSTILENVLHLSYKP